MTKNRTITYNRLSEGNYNFILKASVGDDNVSGSTLIINIIIKKPVWKKWWFFPAGVLFLSSLGFIYIKRREYRFEAERRLLEEKITERTYEIQKQKNEIELQRDLIDEKNIEITSSIRYASHIQNALLPPIELMDKLLPDSFIFARSKDIVSGDFYWLAEKDNKIVFTVADCTGHGVPGAFMSLLGITILNEIVNINGIIQSDTIVTKLREKVIHSLQQTRKDASTSDGMDIALCVLDRYSSKVQFTGGMSNLIFIHEGKFEVVRADRFSVCASNNPLGEFTMKEIDCRKGDVFYLYSDGYQDQFGGNFNKRFLRQHFYQMLLEIHQLPMLKQKEILGNKLNEWIGDYIQTDDITVMGIRL
jgi:serine phosphatase RsbU (regulator of sigma subunit)